MLLRSSSSPILNSCIPNSTGLTSSPEPEYLPQLTRTRSVALINVEYSHSPGRSVGVSARSLIDSDHNFDPEQTAPKKVNGRVKRSAGTPRPVKLKEEKEDEMRRLLCNSGLGVSGVAVVEEEEEVEEIELQTLVGGGGGGGSVVGGGRRFIGGNGSGSHDSDCWRDGTDAYYRKMIEANPGNALLLSNYAKFLKEIRGDLAKAEEYCGRAILANPADGTALSLYADLIWESHKDASRAQTYFDQAIKTEPDDCYVLASYARFLWDAEEEEEKEIVKNCSSPAMFFGVDSQSSNPTPLTATS